jgi:uncharacterized protein with HEPN domain
MLDALEATLLRIRALTPVDKASWGADELRQLAVERLWIIAGTIAEEYRKRAGLGSGVDPWAELYGYRSVLAHALPGQLSPDRVWYESVADLPRLLEHVRAVR